MVTDKTEENDDVEMIPDEEMALDIPVAVEKIKKLKDNLKKCNAERKDYLDGWQRAKADFINYKKDDGARTKDMTQFIIANLILEFLPVLDSFGLAISHHGLPKDVEKGILSIQAQCINIMKKYGLEEIHALDERFSPEFHESVGEIESEKEDNIVVEEIQKGYIIKGKVLRPARVKIAVRKQPI